MKNKININKREKRERRVRKCPILPNYGTRSPSNKNFLYMNLKFWI